MAEPLGERIRVLETTVGDLDARVELNEDGALRAQVVAGRADRDVGEMKAEMAVFRKQNNQLHNATREDLRDLREEVNRRFDEVNRQHAEMVEQINHNFALVEVKFEAQAAGQRQIVELIQESIRRGG